MTINVKFFALGKDLIGKDELALELPENAVVQNVLDSLGKAYPRFAELTSFLIALNMEYVERNAQLHDGDEIAIIPPVSGG